MTKKKIKKQEDLFGKYPSEDKEIKGKDDADGGLKIKKKQIAK